MTQHQKKGCLWWVVRVAVLVAFGLFVLAGAGIWYWDTGKPQRWLVAEGVRRAVGAHAKVEDVSIWGAARVGRIVLRDLPGDTNRAPFITVEGLELVYDPRPKTRRYVPLLTVDRLSIDAVVDETQGKAGSRAPCNFDFLLDILEAPSGGSDPTPYLPETVGVRNMAFQARTPSWSVRAVFEPCLTLWIRGMTDMELDLRGFGVRLEGSVAGLNLPFEGDIAARVLRKDRTLNALVQRAFFRPAAGKTPGFAAMPEDSPLRFNALCIEDAQLDAVLTDAGFDAARFHAAAQIYGLELGPHAMPDRMGALAETGLAHMTRFDAPLRIEAKGELDASFEGQLDVRASSGESAIDVRLSRLDQVLTASAKGAVPGLAEVDFEVSSAWEEGDRALDVDVRHARLEAGPWPAALTALLPVPVDFTEVRVAPSRLRVWQEAAGYHVHPLQVAAAVYALELGPPEAPYYRGPLRVEAHGELKPTQSDLEVEVELCEGGFVRVHGSGGPEALTFDAALEGWTRTRIAAALPERYALFLDYLPGLRHVDGTIKGRFETPGYSISAGFRPEVEGLGDLLLDFEGKGNTDSGPFCQAWAETVLGEEGIRAEIDVDALDNLSLALEISRVTPSVWLRAWTGMALLEDVHGAVNGTVALAARPAEPWSVEADLHMQDPGFGEFRLPTGTKVALAGRAQLAEEDSQLQGTSLLASVGDSLEAVLDAWRLSWAPVGLSGALEGKADLTELGTWFGLEDAYGEVVFAAMLKSTGSGLALDDVRLSGETLGYGGYATPYAMPVSVNSSLSLPFETMAAQLPSMAITVGEEGRIAATDITLSAPGAENLPWLSLSEATLECAFDPLVSAGIIEAGEGTAKATVRDLRMGGAASKASVDFVLDAASLLLTDGLAAAFDAHGEGRFTLDGDLSGTGQLVAREAIAGGATLRNVRADLRADGDRIYIENLSSGLFGGTVKAKAEVKPFAAGFPTRLTAAIEDLDLGIFTTEYEPPSARLTGRVRGSVTVVYGAGGLEDIKVDLRTEEGITVNRDLVEQILLSQYVEGTVAGGKTLSKAIQRTIGKDADRPFDGAWLKLGYEDGEIRGMAKLTSELLNVSIDILADPETLNDAIMLRQTEQVQLNQFDALDTEEEDTVE